ncbi:MAG: hypothetical protein M3161_03160 [Actinomycetota bacterium]|nr:hypothetical protein [Actinomycetota bacterium]
MATTLVGAPAGADGPSPGGMSSDNVEWIKHIPYSINGVGGRVVDGYFYTNDQNKVMIFDVSDPINPVLTGFVPMPQQYMYSREDLDTNGEIMVVPNDYTASPREPGEPGLPVKTGTLYVIDVEDKSNPQIIATVPGASQHTASCVLDCRYVYGSAGAIVDIRDPANPKFLERKWYDSLPPGSAAGGHDVEEIAPGLVLTASRPIMLLDARKDPTRPKLLAVGPVPPEQSAVVHSGRWPRGGKSDFLLFGSETNNRPQCDGPGAGSFTTWDATQWKKTRTFTPIDEFKITNGTYADGRPAANVWGCSVHWLEANPRYGRTGGLVASGWFEHGVRFLDVNSKGKIEEVGYYMPWNGNTSAAYWVTDRIVYTADYNRGIDIIKYNGKL